MSKKVVTLYLTVESYQQLKELAAPKPASQEVDELIRKRVAELGEADYEPLHHVDFEALKLEYGKVVKELDRLERELKDQKVYEDLKALAVRVGVDTERFKNVAETQTIF